MTVLGARFDADCDERERVVLMTWVGELRGALREAERLVDKRAPYEEIKTVLRGAP